MANKYQSTKNARATEILKRLKKTSSVEESSIFANSDIYTLKESVSTPIPIINLALSGKFFDGGITRGLTVIAGVSRSFKTNLGLVCLKAYMDAHEDAVGFLYDSEFSFTPDYLNSFGIDQSRVFITPIVDIDKLKNDIINQVDSFGKDDKIFILIDSIGNLASLKEVGDAQEGKSTQDMTRARALKSLFRMITPRVNLKNIPLFCINHVYSEMSLYPKTIISGGTGVLLSSNTALIMSRRKATDKNIEGFDFMIKIEKSRFIQEGLSLPLTIPKGGMIKKYSGLFDLGLETGFLMKSGNRYYIPEISEAELYWRKDVEDSDEFWDNIFKNTKFIETIEEGLKVSVDQSGLFKTGENAAVLGSTPTPEYDEIPVGYGDDNDKII